MKKKFMVLSLVMSMSLFTFFNSNSLLSFSANEKKSVEIISRRSEYEKHFDNGDGTITAFIETAPLHYYDDGEWIEIDNTLICDKDGNYTNTNNSMNVILASSTSVGSAKIDKEPMVSLEYGGYSISWNFINFQPNIATAENMSISNSNVSVIDINTEEVFQVDDFVANNIESEYINRLESTASYKSLYNNVDIDIDVKSSSVKETIVLNNRNDVPEQFSYYIKCDGLFAEIDEKNSISFFDINNEKIFEIPTAFMFDSSDISEYNYNIEIGLEEYDNGYIYTIIPDRDWILSDDRVYPVMIDPEVIVSDYNGVNSYYNSEANPYSLFRDIYLKIGNETNNGYQSYLSFGGAFTEYGDNVTIKDAKFHLYFLPTTVTSKEIKLYSNQTEPSNVCWNNASELDNYNTYITSFFVNASENYTRYSADITKLMQSWINYTNTSQSVGIPNYGFKLVSNDGTGSTVTAYSNRSNYYKPYYEITYSTATNYILDYAPYKYNNICNNDNLGSIINFQNRMNCYAYALQVYYKGPLASGKSYFLKPGEFAIGHSQNDFSSYAQLQIGYAYFNNNGSYKEHMDFVEQRMIEDANVLNFQLKKLDITTENFIVPTNVNINSERIIAMVIGTHLGIADYHFYVRNGNGTCSNGHGENCSMWSHKQSNGIVSNKKISSNSVELCDNNILEYANSGNYNDFNNEAPVRFFSITKDSNIYNSWHGDGRNSFNGTPYCP